MRIAIYALIVIFTFLAPVQRVDVADLLPIEAVAMYIDNGLVVLETDTKHLGKGETVAKALEDLKHKTSAIVYLDTAEFLIVSKDAEDHILDLKQYLKPKVGVFVGDGKERVKDMAKYLDIHGNTTMLKHWELDHLS